MALRGYFLMALDTLEQNIEMGIRVSGASAAAVARHFRLLAEGDEAG